MARALSLGRSSRTKLTGRQGEAPLPRLRGRAEGLRLLVIAGLERRGGRLRRAQPPNDPLLPAVQKRMRRPVVSYS